MACSPPPSNATSPKPCLRRERATCASVSARSDGECGHVVREVAEKTRHSRREKMSSVSKNALQELAPQGVLRAAINFGNPVLAQKNPESGEPCGVTVDLARELANRLE